MKKFSGFPARTQYSPLPRIFFSVLLPEITDLTELRVTLYTLTALYQKRGSPRYVTLKELLADINLRQCLRNADETAEQTLVRTLGEMAKRGTVLHLSPEKDKVPQDVYLLNAEAERQAVARIRNGELTVAIPVAEGAGPAAAPENESPAGTPDIFTLYEENIGMLTPLIADGLKEAVRRYPEEWIVAAITEAAAANKRSWRYISAILERWSVEGKSDGTYQRNPEKGPDPGKYFRGKYGHVVRR